MKNKYLSIHSLHPYNGKFPPSVPRYFLEKFSKRGSYVLDPFCGCGTTLLEAAITSRKSIGVDINNLAYKISKAKTFIANPKILLREYEKIIECIPNIKINKPITFENKNIWFEKTTSLVIDKLLFLIKKIKNYDYRNIFELIVSSIINSVSNKRTVWNKGYVADNVLPNKANKCDVLKIFQKKFFQILKQYIEFGKNNFNKSYKPKVFLKNILDFKTQKKFDIVITSPPYPFAIDFARYNRLIYYWFGWDLKKATINETGARHKRNKSNAIIDFFMEMKKIYIHLFSLIKKGGYFCMTVADTQRKNKMISFIQWLNSLFIENGWSKVMQKPRVIKNQSMSQKRIKIEQMIVYKKL